MEKLPNKIKLTFLLILISQAFRLLDNYLSNDIFFPIGSNFIIITSLLYIFLAYNITLRQNWARIILTIFYSVEILLFTRSIYKVGFEVMSLGDVRIMIVSLLKQILQVSTLIILFSGASKKWFNPENNIETAEIK